MLAIWQASEPHSAPTIERRQVDVDRELVSLLAVQLLLELIA
jgi:hypothetical protein